MAYSYENELKNLKTAQQNAAMADLQNTRNTTLNNLAAEEARNTANANAQRNTANAQNKISARNFQEYLASTGRANSGISAQARMQNANNLNTQLNNITGNENATLADINRQRTLANNAYASGLASANANIEANYINNLLQQRQQAAQLAQQEREFNESVRQFNEQLRLDREKMYSNFNSGSGPTSKEDGTPFDGIEGKKTGTGSIAGITTSLFSPVTNTSQKTTKYASPIGPVPQTQSKINPQLQKALDKNKIVLPIRG